METATQATLSEIEETLSRRGWRAVFPVRLERIFQNDIGKVRARAVRRSLFPTIIIYNLLLVTDIALLPDTARVSTFLHFAVVTPGILLLYFLYFRLEGYLARQIAEAAVPVLIVGQTLTVMALNSSPNAGYYQYFIPLILLFSNVNQRLETRIANPTSTLILVLYLGVLAFQDLPLENKLAALSFIVVAAYLGFSANLRAQRDTRHSFLLRLREQVRLQAAEADAKHDPLTGLANRRFLADFAKGLASEQVEGAAVSLILMDIDYFKSYNDLHGHGRGDDCIKVVASSLASTVRLFDGTAVRYGGEEFLVLLSGAETATAAACAEAIRRAIEDLAIAHGDSAVSEFVTVSLGVASGHVTPETFQLLLASADAALYTAKAGGRNRVACLDPDAGKRRNIAPMAPPPAKRMLH